MVWYSGRVTLSNLIWYLFLGKRKNWKTFAICSVICKNTHRCLQFFLWLANCLWLLFFCKGNRLQFFWFTYLRVLNPLRCSDDLCIEHRPPSTKNLDPSLSLNVTTYVLKEKILITQLWWCWWSWVSNLFLDLLKFRNLKKIFVNTLKDFIGEFWSYCGRDMLTGSVPSY